MADSYSVRANLSAIDKGFTSTLKNALNSVNSFTKSVTSGMLMGAGMAAFNAITNGARSLIGEIDSANASWKTFNSNLKMLGWKDGEIDSATKELQQFAQQTVYSSSDMATTFSQLAAVGVGNTTELVKGFGGLAAAAENPQQAMKTLSQQATQMAAKPTVAWQDFKLMLEQTPAGISAVARSMGMTTSELVTAVQDGTVATEDFFAAIVKAGGSGTELAKLATEAKTCGQAMDGLKETLGNKLMPAFNVLSNIGIKAINKIADALGGIDGEGIAKKLSGWIKKAKPLWDSFANAAKKVWGVVSGVAKKLAPAFQKAGGAVGGSIKKILDKIGSINVDKVVSSITTAIQKAKPYWDAFIGFYIKAKDVVMSAIPPILNVLKKLGNFLLDNSETISKVIPYILGAVYAYKGFNIVKKYVGPVVKFGKALATMATKAVAGLAGKLKGVSKGTEEVGKSAEKSSGNILESAKAFLLIGAGILLIAIGFALLAQSAIALAEAGWPAIAVMGGLVIALAALAIGLMAFVKTLAPLSKQILPAALAMLALGGAVVLIAVGFALLAQTAIALAAAGWPAIAMMAALVITMALLAIGAAVLAPALAAGAIGFLALGAGLLLCGIGAVLAATSLVILATCLPALCAYGLQGALAIAALGAALIVFAVGAGLAGVACIVLAAGLIVLTAAILLLTISLVLLNASMLLLAVSALLVTVAFVAMKVATIALYASLLMLSVSVLLNVAVLPLLAAMALLTMAAFVVLMAMTLALTVTLIALSVALLAVMASATVAGVGIMLFGVFAMVAMVGLLLMYAALVLVDKSLKSIAKNAKKAEKSVTNMERAISVVKQGLKALGSLAESAMDGLASVFKKSAKSAHASAVQLAEAFTSGLQSIVVMAPPIALLAVAAVVLALSGGQASAYEAGAYIAQGFAQGMLSCLSVVRSAANKLAAEADKAVRAKAKIHSPSRVAAKLGNYWGEGYAGGLNDMASKVWDAAQNLVSMPNVATPNLATAYSGEMSSDYSYYREANYVIEVPLTIDGRQFAKATAAPIQAELNRNQTRDSRKHGVV